MVHDQGFASKTDKTGYMIKLLQLNHDGVLDAKKEAK